MMRAYHKWRERVWLARSLDAMFRMDYRAAEAAVRRATAHKRAIR